jgi:hypothetical protein
LLTIAFDTVADVAAFLASSAGVGAAAASANASACAISAQVSIIAGASAKKK